MNQLTDSTTMREVLEQAPGARRALFKRYHIGGCNSCGFDLNETLAQVCQRNNNLNLAEVLEHIRTSHEQDLKMLIEPTELARMLREESGALKLVDIRTREEFEAVHLPGAMLFSQEQLQEMLGRWSKQSAFVIYDHSGSKSLDAVAYFQGHGFDAVRALRGGIDAWAAEVDATVPRYRLE